MILERFIESKKPYHNKHKASTSAPFSAYLKRDIKLEFLKQASGTNAQGLNVPGQISPSQI